MIKHNLQRKTDKEKHLIKNLRNLTTLVNKITKELKNKDKESRILADEKSKELLENRKKANDLAIEETKKALEAEEKKLKDHSLAIQASVVETLAEINNSSK